MDQKYFSVPFAVAGDVTAVADPVDPTGVVTFTQGWGPNYARDQTTDPLAIPIDRASTNYLLNVITTALAALQRTGIPEWITAANNDGVALPYAMHATVRYSATAPGVTFETYVSLVDANTATPGTDATKWQPISQFVATNAQAIAGTDNRAIMTPAQVAARAQVDSYNFAVDTGAVNAMVITLTPAPTALVRGLKVRTLVAVTNTAAVTANVNGLGVLAVTKGNGSALIAGELPAGSIVELTYDGAQWQYQPTFGRLLNTQVFAGSGTYTRTPGTVWVEFDLQGAAGAGGGAPTSPSTTVVSLGTGGHSGCRLVGRAAAPATAVVTIGGGGTGVAGGTGTTGATSSFGSLATCPGGPGGGAFGPTAGPLFSANASTLPTPTSGGGVIVIASQPGNAGFPCLLLANATALVSGSGGPSPAYGGSTNNGTGGTSNGNPATQAGQGGAGGCSVAAGTVSGGAGGQGKLIVREYSF